MSYTVKVRELDTMHSSKNEIVETNDTTISIEDCKPDAFYSVTIESAEGSVRVQLLPILGERGGEDLPESKEPPPEPKEPRFRVVISWVIKAGKLISFTAKTFDLIDKVEKVINWIIEE